VRPLALLLVELAAAVLCATALWVVARRPGALAPPARRMLVPALALAALGGLQLVPLPERVLDWLVRPTGEARAAAAAVLGHPAPGPGPASLSPADTLDALLRLLAWIGIGVAAAVALRAPRRRRAALVLFAACGAFQALYGSAEYVSGHQHIFGYAKKHYTDSATGTFINRNHFATYLALCLPFALELLLRPPDASTSARPAPRARGWRGLLLGLHDPSGALRAFGALSALAMWAGVFFSYSRGGLVAALAGAALLPAFLNRGRPGLKTAGAILLAPLALVALWQDARAPGERFLGDAEGIETLNSRVPVWRAALGLVRDYPLAGSGYGTFEAAFANRRPAGVSNRWDHAHNDWLQTLIEGGAPAALAALWLTALCLGPRRRRAVSGPPAPGLAAARAGLAAVGVHALVDFPLRIPAIAVAVALAVGLVAAGKETEAPAWRPA